MSWSRKIIEKYNTIPKCEELYLKFGSNHLRKVFWANDIFLMLFGQYSEACGKTIIVHLWSQNICGWHYFDVVSIQNIIFLRSYCFLDSNKRFLYSYACPEQKWRSRTINKHFYMQKFIMHYGKASCHCCVCAQFHSHHSHFLKGSFSSF